MRPRPAAPTRPGRPRDGQQQHHPYDQKPRPQQAAASLLSKKVIPERQRPDVTEQATETRPRLATLHKKDSQKVKDKRNPVYKKRMTYRAKNHRPISTKPVRSRADQYSNVPTKMEETDMTHQTTVPWAMRLGALAVMIALMAVFMTVTVQADDPDWKVAPTGLTVTAGDQAGEIDITWDAHPQTSKTLCRLPSDLDTRRRGPFKTATTRPTGTPTRPRTRFQSRAWTPEQPTRSGSAPGTTTTGSRAGATSQPDRAA